MKCSTAVIPFKKKKKKEPPLLLPKDQQGRLVLVRKKET